MDAIQFAQADVTDPLASAAAPAAAAPVPIDAIHMFLGAHIVVKLVMVGLVIASVISWAIIIEKIIVIMRESASATRFEELFWSGRSLDAIETTVAKWQSSAMLRMFRAVLKEWRLSDQGGAQLTSGGFRERVQAIMDVEAQRQIGRMETRLLFLATAGAAAPFIGLFGTVWGIMNSFTAIAASKDTNLAVVAPGIAEALFATATGLVAAIPAVVFYNKFASDIARFGARLEIFSREFWATISRQLDLHAGTDHGDDDRRL
jgi:biopolymer transport protein TolQ